MSCAELSLFTGAGGGIWGSKLLGWKTVGYVERDEYCQRIIKQRIRDGIFDDAPIFADVRTFDGRPYCNRVDIITAGFPCQPWSLAGRRAGESDSRNLWPDTIRIINEVRPAFALLENVPGLLRHPYFKTILQDIADSRYDARWAVISAAECGAPHIRKRLWILLSDARCSLRGPDGSESPEDKPCPHIHAKRRSEDVADADDQGQLQQESGLSDKRPRTKDGSWWTVEPDMGRVAYGVANRQHRLRALGNGQVPRVAAEAWRRLNALR